MARDKEKGYAKSITLNFDDILGLKEVMVRTHKNLIFEKEQELKKEKKSIACIPIINND